MNKTTSTASAQLFTGYNAKEQPVTFTIDKVQGLTAAYDENRAKEGFIVEIDTPIIDAQHPFATTRLSIDKATFEAIKKAFVRLP